MSRPTDTRVIILAALRERGPSTARELQDATGIAATAIRPVLAGPECERVGFKGEGRQKQIVYKLKPERD